MGMGGRVVEEKVEEREGREREHEEDENRVGCHCV